MTRFDYSSLASTAASLVTRFGASATAVLPGESPFSEGKDWRGSDCGGTKNVTIDLVITAFEDDEIDGDRIRRTDKQGWATPPASGEDLRECRSVIQGGVTYRVEDIVVVDPTGLALAYRFQLRR